MYGMFCSCISLTSINFGNHFNTEKVKNMGSMFEECKKLSSLNLSQFKTPSLNYIDFIFDKCSSLVTLDISNFNFSKIDDFLGSRIIIFKFPSDVLKYLNLLIVELDDWDFSDTDLNAMTNLTVCKKKGSKLFLNTTSIYFRCCETPFNTSKCEYNENYIVVEYSKNFKGNLTTFINGNYEKYITRINLEANNDIDYIDNIIEIKINPGQKIKILFNNPLPLTTMANLFNNITKIKSIDLSHFNSTKVTGINSMFSRFTELEAITFGDNFDTSKVTNMSSLFYGCSALKSIDLSKFNTELVTDMSSMFYNCTKLAEINLTTFKTTNLKTTEYMFHSCYLLESLNLSSFDTTKVTSMREMFYNCSSLTSIYFGSNFNTEKVTGMSAMFAHCKNLTSLDLSHFKTPSLIIISDIFIGCSSLVVLDISNFDMRKMNDKMLTEFMFAEVSNLQYLNLLNVELGDFDFSDTDLNSLGNLTVCKKKGIKPFSNTTSKYFRCCETPFNTSKCNYNYIIVEYSSNFKDSLIGFISRNTEINKAQIYSDDETNYNNDITSIEIKPGSRFRIEFYNLLTNMAYLFYNMTKIKSIDFSHFNSTKVIDVNSMFGLCTELEAIIFGDNFDTSKVINMGSLFYGCSALKSIDLSQLNTKLVTNMSHLFSRCDSLETINFINNINTSSVVDMSNMFYNCRALKITELPNFDTKKVTNMSFMFYGCISLESLNLTSFNTPSLLNMKSMFQNNYYLETLDISSFDTKNVITMAYLFAGCGKLKNLYHLSVVNPSPSIDIYGMFDGCYSLFPLGSPDYGESYNGTISDNGTITNKIVLLGFNKYNLISDTKKINFNIFLYSYEYFDYPENLYLSASIIYNSQLRLLQNENSIECLKGEETSNGIEQYGCEIDIENTDIKAINLDETIDFGTETNLVISPLASDYINNLQNLQNINSYDDLFNNGTIFILENPNLVQNERRFNISGKMNDDPQLPIGKKITLLVKKEQTKDEIDCNVEDNDITKYTLNCQVVNNTISYDLKNSMSVMDNGILLINFEDGNSIINKTDINYSTRRYHSKSNSGISSGAIVAIILCSILAFASVIAIIYCLKKNNIKRSAYNESTSAGIDLNKKI